MKYHHLAPAKMAIIKTKQNKTKQKVTSVCKGVEKLETLPFVRGNAIGAATLQNTMAFS